MAEQKARRVLVWDLPTRLFHWTLAVLVAAAVFTGTQGSSWMVWHGRIGTAILTLVLFRVIWGVIGGRYARFTSFVAGPRAALSHIGDLLARRQPHDVGHNALGGYAILAMLMALGAQAGMGLFSNNDILFFGPFADHLDYDTGLWVSSLHRRFAWVVVGLIGLHVLAILVYRLLVGLDLVSPMVHGRKVAAAHDASTGGHPLLGLGVLAVAAGVVWAALRYGAP
jgi:cytochrome b